MLELVKKYTNCDTLWRGARSDYPERHPAGRRRPRATPPPAQTPQQSPGATSRQAQRHPGRNPQGQVGKASREGQQGPEEAPQSAIGKAEAPAAQRRSRQGRPPAQGTSSSTSSPGGPRHGSAEGGVPEGRESQAAPRHRPRSPAGHPGSAQEGYPGIGRASPRRPREGLPGPTRPYPLGAPRDARHGSAVGGRPRGTGHPPEATSAQAGAQARHPEAHPRRRRYPQARTGTRAPAQGHGGGRASVHGVGDPTHNYSRFSPDPSGEV